MQIMVSVVLGPDDDLKMTADDIAKAVLKDLKGDPDKDSVQVHVQQAAESGTAGMVVPPPPDLPPPPESPPPEPPA